MLSRFARGSLLASPALGLRGVSTSSGSSSYLASRRRALDKSSFQPRVDYDGMLLEFPDERLGTHYELNYRLLAYGVSSEGDNAYHNLHTRHLAMRAVGTADAQKSIHIQTQPKSKHIDYFAESPHAVAEVNQGGQVLNLSVWKKLMAGITRSLTESNDIWVTDGSVGSHPAGLAHIRTITNDANSALYLKHLLHKVRDDIEEFPGDIIFFHSPEYTPKFDAYKMAPSNSRAVYLIMTGEAVLREYEDHELQELSEIQKGDALAKETVVVMLSGTTNLEILRETIATAAKYYHLRKHRLATSASAVENSAGKTALVFDANDNLTSKRVSKDLYSQSGTVWTGDSLHSSFKAVTHSDLKLGRGLGDIVDGVNGNAKVTQPLSKVNTKAANLSVAPPTSVVFLVSDASGALPPFSRLSAQTATKLFTSGYGGKEGGGAFYEPSSFSLQPTQEDSVNAFSELLAHSKADAFAINTVNKSGKALSQSDIDALIASTLDGTAAKATLSPVAALDLGVIGSLDGVKAGVLDPAAGFSKKADFNAAALDLGKKLGVTLAEK
eukprot:TRINITY_DN434_c0_g4_i1.p1 TRINITY_DN434_c0_g4~~TRINITY_DN434_c0_g4_i1.p1  ORF type:complete len:554 (+),score=145.59 TRINITY_DN434_c0_g4_i1:47-1708(+)